MPRGIRPFVVIGGTLLTRGYGFVLGSVLGVLVLGVIQTIITFEGTHSSWWTEIHRRPAARLHHPAEGAHREKALSLRGSGGSGQDNRRETIAPVA